MPNDCLGLYEKGQGKFARINASRFRKDCIPVGAWVLPDGRKLDVTAQRMDRWIASHKAMRVAGIRIPFPVDHSNKSADNWGFVEDLQREGNTLYAVLDVPRADEASKLGTTIREVSISVDPNYRDGTGKEWGEVIRHVAPCTEPVVSGQENFVPIAASGRAGGQGEPDKVRTIFCRKDSSPMNLRDEIARLFGLSEQDAGTDESVFTAVKGKVESNTKNLREAKEARDSVFAKHTALEKEVKDLREKLPKDQPEDSPAVKAMQLRLDRLTSESAEARIAQLRAEGKLTPAMEPTARALLLRRDVSLRLGEKESDVAAQVDALFASLPRGAALDLSERTKKFSETPNPNDTGKEKTELELRQAGTELAAMAQPKTEK